MSEPRTSCAHCGLPIPTMSDDVPRCRKCNKPMCWPSTRDCAWEHFDAKHGPRKIKDIEGPGLDRLTPGEKRAYEEGAWAVES